MSLSEFQSSNSINERPSAERRSPGLRRKNQKRGLAFSMMVAGQAGSGKTTFINTLCGAKILESRKLPDAEAAAADKTVEITPMAFDIDEDGTKISLTVIDTPGFGDNINNEGTFNQIVKYIEEQYDDVLAQESKIKRNPKFQDNRIHVVLYFIQPTGHSLREIDIEFLKRLSPRANVIPIIAKADSMTKEEIVGFKQRIMKEISLFQIPIYDFPIDPENDDDDIKEENAELRALLPFAVIGADATMKVGGKTLKCRSYSWGIVEVENPDHCDFSKLRYCLLHSHLQDLKEITHDILYEQFRTERLSGLNAQTQLKENVSVDKL